MSSTLPPSTSLSARETRFASLVAAALTARSEQLPHDVSERLRFARKQAGERAQRTRAAVAPGHTLAGVSRGGHTVLAGFVPWWQRTAAVLPLLMLVLGVMMAERWNAREEVLAAAEIDAMLLSDTLPPAAYTDPGFAEYLRNPPSP